MQIASGRLDQCELCRVGLPGPANLPHGVVARRIWIIKEGFILWRGIGIDYEGGVLDNPARVAIHFTHRLGASRSHPGVGAAGLAAGSSTAHGTNRMVDYAAALVRYKLASGLAIVLFRCTVFL